VTIVARSTTKLSKPLMFRRSRGIAPVGVVVVVVVLLLLLHGTLPAAGCPVLDSCLALAVA
jgi:hypothetical protein